MALPKTNEPISRQPAAETQLVLDWHDQMISYSGRCADTLVNTNEQTNYNAGKSLPSFTSGLATAFAGYDRVYNGLLQLNPPQDPVAYTAEVLQINRGYNAADITQAFIDNLNLMYEFSGGGSRGSVVGTIDF